MQIEELRNAVKSKVGKVVTFKTCSFNPVSSGAVAKAEGDEDNGDMIYPVINTTNWLDSHADVHAKGIWGTEPIEGVSYIIDHDYSIDGLIASPKDVTVYVERLRWKQLGLDINGTTDALRFAVKLDRTYANPRFLALLDSGVALQNSVRMRYEDVVLCVNNKEYQQEFKNWNSFRKEVANGEEVDQLGYFYYIRKASVFLEGSAVLRGSNEMTPMATKMELQEVTETKEIESKFSYYNTIH